MAVKDDGKIGLDGRVVDDTATSPQISFKPQMSNVKRGIEIINPDTDGGAYAAVGIARGYRSIGAEVGYKFKETADGLKIGGSLSHYYNLITKSSDTTLKASVGKSVELGEKAQGHWSLTAAYNDHAGPYATASASVVMPTNQSYGPLNNVSPYASASVSTDSHQTSVTAGITASMNLPNTDTRLKLNLGAQHSADGQTKAIVRIGLQF